MGQVEKVPKAAHRDVAQVLFSITIIIIITITITMAIAMAIAIAIAIAIWKQYIEMWHRFYSQ